MMTPTPPQSNAERQRHFQRAHPGYDARRKARQRAAGKRVAAQLRAAQLAAAAEGSVAVAQAEPASEGSQLLLFPALRPAA